MQEWLSWLSLAALVSTGLTDQEATLAVNTNKGVHVISDHFLSLTLDPEILLRGTTSLGAARTLNMAKGLAPAYLRLGGPDSNRYTYKMAPDPGEQTQNYTITVPHWIVVNQFARDTGLDLVVCLNILQRDGDSWDPTDARGLVAFSDKMGYNLGWQLGYGNKLLDFTSSSSASLGLFLHLTKATFRFS
uniref:Uncharacterized protein n=1 Tax=Timema genevievae TaxID=629358 RepID=A0A7R9JT84_TIMGE|nr:unnamed protein product [Timema genevievae]